jgi:hypothetical protein
VRQTSDSAWRQSALWAERRPTHRIAGNLAASILMLFPHPNRYACRLFPSILTAPCCHTSGIMLSEYHCLTDTYLLDMNLASSQLDEGFPEN